MECYHYLQQSQEIRYGTGTVQALEQESQSKSVNPEFNTNPVSFSGKKKETPSSCKPATPPDKENVLGIPKI